MKKAVSVALSLLCCVSLIVAQPPAAKDDDIIKVKDDLVKAAMSNQKAAEAKTIQAKAVYDKCLLDLTAAERETARADAEYRVALADDAQTRADEAKQAAAKAREIADLALSRVSNKQPAATPVNQQPTTQQPANQQPTTPPPTQKPTAAPSALKEIDAEKANEYTPRDGSKVASGILRVIVPPGAKLIIDGVLMKARGAERVFISPPVEIGTDFYYEVIAAWYGPDGNPVYRKKRAAVRGGETTTETFN